MSVKAVDTMNESDVREAVVRPFLNRLGYEFGTEANLRTEVTLRWPYAQLGRKKPGRDPELRGKADYICEVIPYGRWITEVKPPHQPLTLEDSYQAHTYSTNPEIAAWFYLLTNGKTFRVYHVGNPDTPVLTWEQEETELKFPEVKNILGPNALHKMRINVVPAPGKPLADGLGPQAKIVGGFLVGKEARCPIAQMQQELQKQLGLTAPITGKEIIREPSGLIRANFESPGAFFPLHSVVRAMDADTMSFETSDEFLSIDPDKPSIFQGMKKYVMKKGTEFPGVLGAQATALPFDWEVSCFVQGVGFLQDQKITGVYSSSYILKIPEVPKEFPPQAVAILDNLKIEMAGDFNLIVQ